MKQLTAGEVWKLRRTERIAIDKRLQELAEDHLMAFFSMEEQRKVWKRLEELWSWMFNY